MVSSKAATEVRSLVGNRAMVSRKILFRVENKKNNEDNWPATYLGTKYIQPLLGPLVCLLAVGSSTE